jgi:type IV pilus assembly protein PilA
MKSYFKKMNTAGFTLVELMVVVAIIGILASIAIPQYSKFQAKARQSEAKIQLGGAYTVEQGYAAENSSYTRCLGQIGYQRDGSKFYYTIGFNTADTSNCAPNGAQSCLEYSWSFTPPDTYTAVGSCTEANLSTYFSGTVTDGTAADLTYITTQANIGATVTTQSTFTIGALGKILKSSTNYDIWTIDQAKQILNTTNGLN